MFRSFFPIFGIFVNPSTAGRITSVWRNSPDQPNTHSERISIYTANILGWFYLDLYILSDDYSTTDLQAANMSPGQTIQPDEFWKLKMSKWKIKF